MSHPDPAGLIAARGGRVTRTRTSVLSVLFEAGRPISHDEVGEALDARGISHDRVTLYRTLDWLVGHDLAHKVAGPDRAWRFNAAREEGHQHAHFQCDRCGKVFCLESLQPAIAATLPSGFRLGRAELTFHGLCPACPGAAGAGTRNQVAP